MDIVAHYPLITLGILALVAGLTLWFAGPGYNKYSVAHAPTILTSIGIFGTFLGVALGLLKFDTGDIQASVPGLIEGLKTAFWTSIAGLLGGLIVKFRHLLTVLSQRRNATTYQGATVSDLARLLGDIHQSLEASRTETNTKGVENAITQLQRDQRKDFASLQQSIESYQTNMVEANTTALIEALKIVMRDFNTKIDEQYGDNFKALNKAVGQMLEWQQSYKRELSTLLESQAASGALLQQASQAYEKMVAHSEVFTTVSQSLGTLLSGLQLQSESLDANLSQLAKVADQAASGLPQLETRIASITSTLATSVNENQTLLSATLEQCGQNIQETVRCVNENFVSAMNASQQQLHDQIQRMVNRTEQQIVRLDDAMETELVKALTTFGYQLTSLSEKFVSDYTPLTQKLQEVIKLADKLGPGEDALRTQRPRISAQ